MSLPSAKEQASHMVLWVLLGASYLAAFTPRDMPGIFALLIGWIPVLFAFWHFSLWAGKLTALISFSIIAIVSFSIEALGVATGLVFGNYYYPEGPLGPLLLGVPPLIQLQYFAMGYACLLIARAFTGTLHRKAKGWWLIVSSALAAFGMTMLDLASDPMQSTVLGDWIWRDGGSYFGVPIHNFVGWFVETFIFFVLVQLVLLRKTAQTRIQAPASPRFDLMGLLLFGTFPVTIIVRPFLQGSSEIVDAMAGVALFAVIPYFVAALTAYKVGFRTSPN